MRLTDSDAGIRRALAALLPPLGLIVFRCLGIVTPKPQYAVAWTVGSVLVLFATLTCTTAFTLNAIRRWKVRRRTQILF